MLVLFAVTLGPFLIAVLAGGWLALTLSPLQKFYLPSYMASSLGALQPGNLTPLRWVEKTAPGRKAEPMTPEDAAPGGTGKLPLALSAQAMAEGWKGVALGPKERLRSSELAPYLRASVYEDESAGWLLGLPILNSFCGLMLLCCGFRFTRHGWGDRTQEQRHGRPTKGPELSLPAWLPGGKSDGIRLRLRGDGALSFGRSFSIPKRLEASHILLMGDTGTGKSVAIRQILRQVHKCGEAAIVYDPAMDFVGEFYSPERGDLILNPLDARSPYWYLGDEILRPEDATAIAAALLPEKEYEKAFFTDAPRRVLAHLLRQKPHVRDLLRWMSDPEQIELRVKGTPLAALVDPGAPAQRAGVLSSLNLIADSLELLPQHAEYKDPRFATSEWHEDRTRWVFLTSSSGYREKLLPLHSVWLDLFILRMMGYCQDHEAKPVWFVLDELASLNKLPQLHTAVTENRKYGNPVVLGFQGRSQLEKRYGQDAEAMLSQPATKVFFKTSEPRAAKWISDAIGEIEVERLKEPRSMGLLRSKKSYTMEIATKPLIMASEIAGLAPLRAFIKQENRVVPVRFKLAKKRKKQPEFIERKREQPALRKATELPEPAPAQAPPKKPVQDALPLIHAPAAERKGFVWDSSNEIE